MMVVRVSDGYWQYISTVTSSPTISTKTAVSATPEYIATTPVSAGRAIAAWLSISGMPFYDKRVDG
jgi:hypothetical protein